MKDTTVNKVKILLANKYSLLYYFYGYLRYRLFALLGLNFLLVLFDSLGLTLFIPLLSIADNPAGMSGDSNILSQTIIKFFALLHLPLTVVTMLALILIIFSLKALFTFLAMSYQTVVLQFFAKSMRIEATTGLANLSYRTFIGMDVGRLHNTLSGESNLVAAAFSSYIDTFKGLLIVLVYVGLSFVTDWKFSLIVIAGTLVSNLLYNSIYKKTKQISREITGKNHDYTALLIQNVNSFKYLKATGRTEIFKARLLKVLNDLISSNIRIGRINAFVTAVREPLLIVVICFAIGVQLLFFKSRLSEIMIILVLFYRAMTYILSLQVTWNAFLTNSGSVENMRSFKSFLENNKDRDNGKIAVQTINQIELKDGSIRFGEHVVLKSINMQVARNQSVAFVGESGSGKTTLVNVIAGLLKLDGGQMFINNKNADEISLYEYRSNIGYISQEPVIFNADIFDNITFWAERTPENISRFSKALRDCSLDTFVESLPDNYSSMLGNNGLNISGGQKQRISIARELYRDIDVLILDEATSALDSATEVVIKESIESLKGKLTIITIAHRLSTIRSADCIYLLNKGTIEAYGDFDTLKEKSAYFKQMTLLQGI